MEDERYKMRITDRLTGLAFGGDYNPEQWPPEVWDEDIALMAEAGVTMVTVGVFSWAMLEPSPGYVEFGWLDDILDRLHRAGIAVDLATATASPPPWFVRAHPEILPITRDGLRLYPGSRQTWCPSSPVYREASVAMAARMAKRYGNHPGLAMWHVGNEYGCHNAHCHCPVSTVAFRRWLAKRYGSIGALNDAWGTAFWSQRYRDFEEIHTPRLSPTFVNPTQQLDYARFSSDELLECYRAERDVLRQITPEIPITTNFMVMQFSRNLDYWSWAPEVDMVSNDHYLDAADPEAHIELSFSADLTRGLAEGNPWLLMEHSTSAVNWQPRNIPKMPGQMARNSIAHVARGSEGAMFFQWRASRAGTEKFHSAMLPHAGTDSRIWREVVELGQIIAKLAPIARTTVEADVAMVFDWNAWWATELDSHPTADVRYLDRAHAWYRALWQRNITCDMVKPGESLEGYRLLIVPTLYLASEAAASAVGRFVESGGVAVITYFSGIVDESDHVHPGPYPGAFRNLLGIRTEEFVPLRSDQTIGLDIGGKADVWAEYVHLEGAEAIVRFVGAPLDGWPAVTSHRFGDGTAWYVAARTDPATTRALAHRILTMSGIDTAEYASDVEVVTRSGPHGRFRFIINHGVEETAIGVAGHDLVTDRAVRPADTVAAGGVAVVHEAPGDGDG